MWCDDVLIIKTTDDCFFFFNVVTPAEKFSSSYDSLFYSMLWFSLEIRFKNLSQQTGAA